MDIDEYENFELDLKNTLIANIFMILGFPMFALYTYIFSNIMETSTTAEIGLILGFIYAWSCLNMFRYFANSVQIEYKLRTKEN